MILQVHPQKLTCPPRQGLFQWGIHLNQPLIFRGHVGVSKNRGTPKNGWFIMENHINMDDLGVSLFSETSMLVFRGIYHKTTKGFGPPAAGLCSVATDLLGLHGVGNDRTASSFLGRHAAAPQSVLGRSSHLVSSW